MTGDLIVLNEHLYGTMRIPVEKRTAGSTHAATIKPGEPVNKGVTGAVAQSGNFAVLPTTGFPKDGTDLFLGVCKEESTETATVDGSGNFYLIGLGTRVKGKASTPANINTVAKFAALVLDNVDMDGIALKSDSTVTTPYTIDENNGDDANVNGLQLLVADIVLGTLEARVVAATCLLGNGI